MSRNINGDNTDLTILFNENKLIVENLNIQIIGFIDSYNYYLKSNAYCFNIAKLNSKNH